MNSQTISISQDLFSMISPSSPSSPWNPSKRTTSTMLIVALKSNNFAELDREEYVNHYKKILETSNDFNPVADLRPMIGGTLIECVECARTLAESYSLSEDRDLYVTGDLYDNDVATPAMIVVPRRRRKVHGQNEKEAKKQNWESNVKEPPSPTPMPRPTPKPVDEDLYKISPELLYAKTRKKKGLCFFPSCFLPTCFAYDTWKFEEPINVHISEIEE
ncbi:hypothetical protein RJT34_12896 [Clitoria ternatea]|uniref:Uncharacterized protein n=1 Tax=Clitoria ternatea TaxID=43366 RepID=A0AAN9JQP3_CLITE